MRRRTPPWRRGTSADPPDRANSPFEDLEARLHRLRRSVLRIPDHDRGGAGPGEKRRRDERGDRRGIPAAGRELAVVPEDPVSRLESPTADEDRRLPVVLPVERLPHAGRGREEPEDSSRVRSGDPGHGGGGETGGRGDGGNLRRTGARDGQRGGGED